MQEVQQINDRNSERTDIWNAVSKDDCSIEAIN
jgi:hypothetical protein